ncbi:MAG TPA: hypothetical protein VMT55_00105 [Candidatus Sulfotelmatobacter sp.]|nr:hypothetical protein [Candidatus Sulfotelmatobacter sp.]
MELNGRKVVLPSGAELYVNAARYEDTENFLGAFLDAIEGLPSPEGENDTYAKTFAEVATSRFMTRPKLKAAMWTCLQYCLVKKGEKVEKVTPKIFDGQVDRGDAAQIFFECAAENFSPFLKGLWNVSQNLLSLLKNTQK